MARHRPWANLPDPKAPCANPDLTRTLDNLADPAYWAQLCPELTVSGKLGSKAAKIKKPASELVKDAREQVLSEGVVQLHPSDLQWGVDVHVLARSMVALMQAGWPASFLIMYDEVWALVQQASSLMAGATGGNACNMDVLCWYVDPNAGAAGFSPHRDRQPDNSPATFRPDGTAMYSTCWVPLTDACPENSCLYVVPRWADPGYFAGDDDDGPDPLAVALAGKEDYQAIRALPAEAGSALIFTHRIIHWGSRGRKGFHTPRLAVSWGCADDAYEPPYFARSHLPYPPMALRAALACGQMLIYHERFDMTKRQLSLYYKYFVRHGAEFDAGYREKCKAEFVAASRELVDGVPAAGGGMGGGMKMGGMGGGMKMGGGGMAAAQAAAAAANGSAAAKAAAPEKDRKKQKAVAAAPAAEKADEVLAVAGRAAKKAKREAETASEAAAAAAATDGGAKGAGKKKAGAGPAATEAAAAVPAGKKGKADKAAAAAALKAAAAAAAEEPAKSKVKTKTAAAAAATGVTANGSKAAAAGKKDVKKKGGKEEVAAVEALTSNKSAGAGAGGKKGKAAPPPEPSSSDEEEDDDEDGLGFRLGDDSDDNNDDSDVGDSDDELMEDALEAMLDAELAGKDLGRDDFDELDSEDGEEEEGDEDGSDEEEGGDDEDEEDEDALGWKEFLAGGGKARSGSGCGRDGRGNNGAGGGGGSSDGDGNNSDDELMEDALEAMLDAELAGKDLGRDDFDDFEEESEEGGEEEDDDEDEGDSNE
ncbi:hypothetical protein HYH02_010413 [Chlamydomonas schloesseri]|uniref:Uncharacterized protein n=1 Tax=Chlamydomonas schloesseri TaxID=2026947 RepID=A0A835TKI8_9CHLO|nr:hypothetical protein HYH02_010413 [Chlamydomonas schloesseri]|eukprot:KAG2440535.1 hypothetical protein HYH02_010413 [Chlamydomonas schloesseri]